LHACIQMHKYLTTIREYLKIMHEYLKTMLDYVCAPMHQCMCVDTTLRLECIPQNIQSPLSIPAVQKIRPEAVEEGEVREQHPCQNHTTCLPERYPTHCPAPRPTPASPIGLPSRTCHKRRKMSIPWTTHYHTSLLSPNELWVYSSQNVGEIYLVQA